MTFTETIPIYMTAQGYKVECTDINRNYYTIDLPFLNSKCKDGIEVEKIY